LRSFDFLAPTSIDETLQVLDEHGPDATLLAGGQSLLILLRQGLVAPEVLIGLKRVGELATVGRVSGDGGDADGLRIGAMVSYGTAATDPAVAATAPVLAAAAGSVGSVHIRNLGTVGGSLCHADPAGDVPTVLLALDAVVEAARPGGTTARYAVDGFFRGLFETRLGDDELLVSVDVPAQPPGATFGYRRFSFRHGEYPMAVAACRLEWDGGRCAGARAAVGGGGPHPRRLEALERRLLGAGAAEAVEAVAADEPFASLRPIADVRGSEAWKLLVVSDLVRKTVADAAGAAAEAA
jgi:aerobic carbon-monoxide dehydrogenase medium subunit